MACFDASYTILLGPSSVYIAELIQLVIRNSKTIAAQPVEMGIGFQKKRTYPQHLESFSRPHQNTPLLPPTYQYAQ